MKNRFWLLGCLVFLQCHGFAVAAQEERPRIAPPADWVLPVRPDPVVPAATEAPVQVLLSDQQVRLTTDAVETYAFSRMKIQTRQGLDALGTLGFTWKPDSDVLTVHRLALVRDGQVQDLLAGGEAFEVLRREDQLEQAVLTGMLTAVIQPEGLRVGDVIEMSHTLRRRDPVVHDAPDSFYMWANGQLSNARLRVLWPESLPVRWKASSHMPAGEPVKANGWLDLTYQLDEVVPLLQPTGAPARFAALRTLDVTTYKDWQALSQRLAPLYVDAAKLGPQSPLRGEVDRIRREHASPADRAAAALRLVQDEIRYVLLAMNDGGLKPAPVDETWQRRFGDCKAKSVMLVALLRELGIESEVVAVSTSFGDGLDARLPGVGKFDHVLVRARIGGKVYWLDGTRTGDRALANLQPPPFYWALPLTVRGSGLVPIPREPLQEPAGLLSLQIDATNGIDLPAPFKAEMKVSGDAALALRRIEELPAASREESLRSFWRRLYRGVEIERTTVEAGDAEGTVTWTASGTIRMEWDPDYNTYEPHDMSVGYRADFSRPRGTDAEAPYLVSFPDYTRTIEVIKLPPQRAAFTVTGTDIKRTVAGVEHRRTARVEGNVFTAERTQRSVAPEFPASERAEAEKVLLEMSRNNLFLKRPDGYLPTAAELRTEAERGFEEADHYYSLGTDMQRRGMEEEAKKAYDKALEMDPAHSRARIARARLLARMGDMPACIADLEAGLVASPGDKALREELLSALLSLRQWDKAGRLMDDMLATNNDPKLRARRAFMYHQQGDTDRAMRELETGIQAHPKTPDFYAAKAALLLERDSQADAVAVAAALHKALGPEGGGAREAARLLSGVGQAKAARPYLDEDLASRPNAESYLARSELQEQRSAAIADLRAALELPDLDPNMEYRIGRVLLAHQWYGEAAELLGKRSGKSAVQSYVVAQRGIARWKLGDQAAARRDFEAAARAAGPGELNNLCWEKASNNVALEVALEECERALAGDPDCGACEDSRAFVLLRLGRLADAVRAYDRALQLRPREPASMYGRGIAYIRLGNREAGEKDLAAARAIRPTIDVAFETMEVTP